MQVYQEIKDSTGQSLLASIAESMQFASIQSSPRSIVLSVDYLDDQSYTVLGEKHRPRTVEFGQ